MRSIDARPCGDQHDLLGEGPRWNESAETLGWVDVRARTLYRGKWDGHRLDTRVAHVFDDEVSCALPVDGRPGSWLVPCGRGLIRYEEDGSVSTIGVIESDPTLQLNDAACDPGGRLWVGSFSRGGETKAGSLYMLDLDGTISRRLRGITTSNGIAWSPAGDHMYYVDSPTRRIEVFDYDPADGLADNRRQFVDLASFTGIPDGLAVDVDGGVWVAMWDGYAVLRFSSDGTLTHRVEVPVSRPTAPCLGARDLSTMFITTARVELTEVDLALQPDAGRVFACAAPWPGLPANAYAGPLASNSLWVAG